MQIAAAGGFFVHVNVAVVIVDHGDGLTCVIPQTALAADPGGGVFRVRLQRRAGLDGGAAAAAECGVLFGDRAGRSGRCACCSALGRGGENCDGPGDEQRRETQRYDGDPFCFHDCCDPFFNRVFPKMIAERRKAASGRLHADEDPGIGGADVAAEAAEHRLVAGELQIPVRQHVHHPHQRVEPVDADGGDQQELGEDVEPLDVHELMLQHVAQRSLIRPVRLLWHQDDRAQDAEGKRRGDAAGLPDGDGAPQRVRLQPAAGKAAFHREGRPELPAAAPIRDGEHHRADRRAHGPDDHPDRNLRRRHGSCLLRSGSRCRLRRREIRQGRGCGPFRCRGRAPRQQRIDAERRWQRDRHQQPHERRGPERQKGLFRQPLDRQRADDRDDQDHDAAREAHL